MSFNTNYLTTEAIWREILISAFIYKYKDKLLDSYKNPFSINCL